MYYLTVSGCQESGSGLARWFQAQGLSWDWSQAVSQAAVASEDSSGWRIHLQAYSRDYCQFSVFQWLCWRSESCGPSYRLPEWPHRMVADFPHCFCYKLFITKQHHQQHKCVNTERWGSLGIDLEAILEAGNYTDLRIFLFPLKRPGKEWCLRVTMRLATVKTFLTFRVGKSWMTSGVGQEGIIGMMYHLPCREMA